MIKIRDSSQKYEKDPGFYLLEKYKLKFLFFF